MGPFQQVKFHHGFQTYKNVKILEKSQKRLASLHNRKIFLLKCRQHRVVPSHIQNKFNCLIPLFASDCPYKHLVNKLKVQFGFKVLNIEIKATLWSLKNLKHDINILTSTLAVTLSQNLFNILSQTLKSKYIHNFNVIKEANIKKLHMLLTNTSSQLANSHTSISSVLNLTNKTLPTQVTELLQYNPNVAINCEQHFPIVTIISDLEYAIRYSDLGEMSNLVRAQCTNKLMNHKHKISNNNKNKQSITLTQKSLLQNYHFTKEFLRNNKEILLTKSDKGNITVVITRSFYEEKMSLLLSDEKTYKIINGDLTTKLENRSNKIITGLFNSGHIDKKQYQKLRTINSNPPRIYGLVKAHKQDHSLRPIVSYTGSPLYNISKFLAEHLRSITPTSRYALKNSFDFVTRIQDTLLPANYKLVSFDVVSLYTNISKNLLTKALNSIQFANENSSSNISIHTLSTIIDFIMDSTYFIYKDTFYTQISGCAMGSPVSPILAQICMDFLITSALAEFDFHVPFIHIFVDDIILALPSDKINLALDIFNRLDTHIKFTHEVEGNNKLPYLDTIIHKNLNKLKTNWYMKPFSTGRIINHLSCHSTQQKISVLKSLKHRMFNLSHREFHTENIERFKTLAKSNGYPKKLINHVLHNTQSQNRHSDGITVKYYARFPYIKGLSETIKGLLRRVGIIISFYPLIKISSLYANLKHKLKITDQSSVIYKIPCSDCNKVYIGTTKNKLLKRLKQHENDCNDKNAHKPNRTALANHHFTYGHNFNFDSATIIHTENNSKKRYIAESIKILLEPNKVNFKSDTQDLSLIYAGLLACGNTSTYHRIANT